jgi:proteasome lid subunit RPN8/RPN11
MIDFEIMEQADRAHPEECCGFVVSQHSDGKEVVVVCPNTADDPIRNYRISTQDYLSASRLGKIKAVYHSHKESPVLSELDKVNMKGHDLPVFVCFKNNIYKYYPEGGELTGRLFKIGECDCLTLVQDYYKKLGVEISDYEREEGWYKSRPNMFADNYKKEGFINLLGDEDPSDLLAVHDIILLEFSRILSHACVYLGDGTVLIHPKNGYSRVETYGKALKNRTKMVLRYKQWI